MTAVAPVRFEPVMVTVVPTGPLVGAKLVTVGGAPVAPFSATMTMAQYVVLVVSVMLPPYDPVAVTVSSSKPPNSAWTLPFCRRWYPDPAVATPPSAAAPTATSRSLAFVLVADDVCSMVVAVPAVNDPLALWSTVHVRPEYSAMYKLESALPLLPSVAVTAKLPFKCKHFQVIADLENRRYVLYFEPTSDLPQETLRDVLATGGPWDYVVLQEKGGLPAGEPRHPPGRAALPPYE